MFINLDELSDQQGLSSRQKAWAIGAPIQCAKVIVYSYDLVLHAALNKNKWKP